VVAEGATIPNKKRKRTDLEESSDHDQQMEKIGKASGSATNNKIRRTESLDKRIQNQQSSVSIEP
jgi:hypothetical protein